MIPQLTPLSTHSRGVINFVPANLEMLDTPTEQKAKFRRKRVVDDEDMKTAEGDSGMRSK
jgi:hypothetical protein